MVNEWNKLTGILCVGAEVTVGGHVLDRSDLDAGEIHRHDDLGDALVRRTIGAGATDHVAEVGLVAEAGPDLLAVDDELIAVAHRLGGEAGEIAPGVGL